MAQLDQAAKRLQAALDRLEQAVDMRPRGGGAGDLGLRRALDVARKENAALQDVAETVARRLDATIGRLRSTLES